MGISPECLHLVACGRGGGLRASVTLRAMPAGIPLRASQAGQTVREKTKRLRETNWSSKNRSFADGLVTLLRKIKYS